MTSANKSALLFANEAFYLAFQTHDMRAMDALWSSSQPVQCIHPGWPPLFGRDTVMESWLRLLSNRAAPNITFSHPTATIIADIGMVTCFEALPGGNLVATNLFHHDGAKWQIFHHQASPSPPPEISEDDVSLPPRLQ
jgi:hypothetical protein